MLMQLGLVTPLIGARHVVGRVHVKEACWLERARELLIRHNGEVCQLRESGC